MVAIGELTVHGALPAGLSARYVRLEVGSVRAGDRSCPSRAKVRIVTLHAGRAAYQRRTVAVDGASRVHRADGGRATTGVVAFAGSVFALAPGFPAIELTSDLDAARLVDLAGAGRTITAPPKLDPLTGELHLLARDRSSAQSYVTVSRGLRTRTTRAIEDAPGPLRDLAVAGDAVLVLSDDHVGVGERRGDGGFVWTRDGANGPVAVHAHDAGGHVVLLCLTPQLERWTMAGLGRGVDRHVLDATPAEFAAVDQARRSRPGRYVWTAGGSTVACHDLLVGDHQRVNVGAHPSVGDLVFMADPERAGAEDGGWLVAMAHDGAADPGALVVLDGAAVARGPMAVVRLPGPMGLAGPGGWLPPDCRQI